MTDMDARLRSLLGQDLPPARDAAFRVATLERLARRRLRRGLTAMLTAGLAVSAAVWAAAPGMASATAAGPPGTAPAMCLLLGLAAAGSAFLYLRRPA